MHIVFECVSKRKLNNTKQTPLLSATLNLSSVESNTANSENHNRSLTVSM